MHIKFDLSIFLGTTSMSYKNLCFGVFLTTSSFFAMAADSDAYEKCASIEASGERVKCYDSLVKKPSKKQNPPESLVSKNDAKAMIVEMLNSDSDMRDNPFKKATTICAFDDVLAESFGGATVLDATILQSRISPAMDRLTKDPDFNLKILKCAINSEAFAQSMKEKGEQDRSAPLIDMDDLRTDMASLDGRKVRVQGVGNYMMNMFILKKNSTDMSPIIVDITKLQRDQHRKILQQCADIMTGCRVTVYGTVGKVSFENGISAESVEW